MPSDLQGKLGQADSLLVGASGGRTMHYGYTDRGASFPHVSTGYTLCGRAMYGAHSYPLGDQATMPWRLCTRCDAAANGRSETPS